MLAAGGCKSPDQFSPRQTYESGWLELNRGELNSALRKAEVGLQHFPSPESDWHWRFTILKGETLLRLHRSEESLALLERELPPSLSASDLAVWRRMTQGAANAFLRRFEDAGKLLGEAQQLAEAHAPSLLGEVALRKGTLAFLRNDPELTAAEYHKALALAQSQKDGFLEAAARGSLGLIATRQEHYDESIDWDRSALELSRSLNAQSSVARILGNLGWSYFELGDYDQSLSLFQQSGDAFSRMGVLDLQTRALIMAGLAHYYLRDFDDAEKESEEALKVARSIRDPVLITQCLNNLSMVALSRQQPEPAEKFNLEAHQSARSSTDPDGELSATLISGRIQTALNHYREAQDDLTAVIREPKAAAAVRWEAEARLAKLYDMQHQNARAGQAYRRSIETIQSARSSVGQDELRFTFLSSSIDFFDDYIDFLIRQGRVEDALKMADLTRASALAEGSQPANVDAHSTIRNLHPQQIAQKSRATLLLYWLGRNQSYLWVISPSKISHILLPKQAEIDPIVRSYREAVLDGRDLLASGDADGRKLYSMLIEPTKNLLAKDSRVILLPAESLYGLNFEALIVPGPVPHYWIEDVTLSTASSLAVLSRSRLKNRDAAKNLLLIGNAQAPSSDFPPLAQASAEMAMIAGHFPQSEEEVLEGKNATPSAYIRSHPERFSYLHFVTHGTASHTRPLESAVILSQDGDSFKLYARDIVAHPLQAQLVTISACNGAGTRAYAGEGLVGLSWAFLRAGAHNVIASLWEVSDASSTPQLMDALYEGLTHGEEPATALRNAKLSILKANSHSVFAKPFYWAPFQLYAGS